MPQRARMVRRSVHQPQPPELESSGISVDIAIFKGLILLIWGKEAEKVSQPSGSVLNAESFLHQDILPVTAPVVSI